MDLKGFIDSIIITIIKPIAGLILAFAIVFFIWNILQIIRKSDKPDELVKLKTQTMWGVIAIFMMVSLWGIVYMLVNTLEGAPTPNTIQQILRGGF